MLLMKKTHKPNDGVYVRGLYVEGARWDYATKQLADSRPKELFSEAPVIWFRPMKTAEIKQQNVYVCPMYRTSARRGTLSTTGHSTNFVMSVRLPIGNTPASYWTRCGVALLSQLDD